jgi:hypothetical protein
MKVDENLSSGSRIIPCGWMNGRTDMTNLMVTFYSVVNVSENDIYLFVGWLWTKCMNDDNGRQYIK